MRRKEKEITDRQSIDEILRTAQTGYLGLNDSGQPYVVPVFFGYDGTSVYIHTALQGRKIDILKKESRTAFTASVGVDIVTSELACSFSAKYKSVMIEGSTELITEPSARIKALDIIMKKYSEDELDEAEFEYDPRQLDRTLVLKLSIKSVSGKQSG